MSVRTADKELEFLLVLTSLWKWNPCLQHLLHISNFVQTQNKAKTLTICNLAVTINHGLSTYYLPHGQEPKGSPQRGVAYTSWIQKRKRKKIRKEKKRKDSLQHSKMYYFAYLVIEKYKEHLFKWAPGRICTHISDATTHYMIKPNF